MNCKRDPFQMRCYHCNYLGHTAKFFRNNSQTSKGGKINPSLKRRGQDKLQLAQYAELILTRIKLKITEGMMKAIKYTLQ